MKWVLLAAAVAAAPAFAQVQVQDAWARATPPGAKTAAGYMVLRSTGGADRLVGASSPAAERVEMHTSVRDGDVARMREVKAYDIPAGGSVELKPGGNHLMLINPKAPLKAGDRVPLVLKFEKAGEVKTDLQVRPLNAASDQQHGHPQEHKH